MPVKRAPGNSRMSSWKNLESLTRAVSFEEKQLSGVESVVSSSDFRVAGGQRIPREPHRYSGRTSMLANINVSEPRPPEDPDSGLSYTMEGYMGLPPSSMIPFFWSPGWNSVQSVNKYQEEVGAALRGGDPGMRLIEPKKTANLFAEVPEKFERKAGKFLVVALHHIFGSEELSARSNAVSKRVPKPNLLVHVDDAKELNISFSKEVAIDIGGQKYNLEVKLSSQIQRGAAGLPQGLPGMSYSNLPEWGSLIK